VFRRLGDPSQAVPFLEAFCGSTLDITKTSSMPFALTLAVDARLVPRKSAVAKTRFFFFPNAGRTLIEFPFSAPVDHSS
jgi:hypothetical protein